MRNLKIATSDQTKIVDKVDTYKRWFNGIKHFFSVKILPIQKKKGD